MVRLKTRKKSFPIRPQILFCSSEVRCASGGVETKNRIKKKVFFFSLVSQRNLTNFFWTSNWIFSRGHSAVKKVIQHRNSISMIKQTPSYLGLSKKIWNFLSYFSNGDRLREIEKGKVGLKSRLIDDCICVIFIVCYCHLPGWFWVSLLY